MHSIKQLEKQWMNYRIEKFLKSMIKKGLMFIGVGFLYLGYVYSSNITFLLKNFKEKISTESSIPSIIVKSEQKNEENGTVSIISTKINSSEEEEHSVQSEKYEVALEPIIPIINMDKEKQRTHVRKRVIRKTVHKKTSSYLSKKELSVLSHADATIDSRKTKKMNFKSSSLGYIDTMKAKFKRTKKPREALLLAKAFYRNSNYKEAEQWALTANKLNSNLDESWLLFAKAKAKLGKKHEAIKVLVAYYKKSRSLKAKALIEQIKRGRI